MIRTTIALIFLLSFLKGFSVTGEICDTCEYKTVAEGFAAANTGDTLIIKAGTYQCKNLILDKSLALIGEKGAILDGGMAGYVLKIMADSITVSGFKIINSGRSYTKDFAAIYSFRANYFTIENNEIVDPFFGILLEKSKKGIVKNNRVYGTSVRIDDAGNGIHLWHCSEVEITGNEVFKLRDGIYLEFVDNSVIANNHTHDNVRYGLHFMFSNHDRYFQNTFESNGAGVAVMFSKFIVMKENNFIKNWGTASYGLLLKEIYDAEVVDNNFTENTIGIFIEGSTRINYTSNLFEQNGWAIKVSGGCYANLFSANDFIGNSFDVSYDTKMNDNRFDGNYWSDYTGYDLNKDGIGDIPYRPVKLFSYIVNRTPETIILLRSLFVDIINFSEKVSPVFTPDELVDNHPSIKSFQ
ncbi:MAG: nitrous oxide reductase family maturation protein NosD [Cyclobacteriaceae bacterium]